MIDILELKMQQAKNLSDMFNCRFEEVEKSVGNMKTRQHKLRSLKKERKGNNNEQNQTSGIPPTAAYFKLWETHTEKTEKRDRKH